MPRPSELLARMIQEAAEGKRPDGLHALGRWLDNLNAQSDPTTLKITGTGGGGGALGEPYLTVGAATDLTGSRQIAHDSTLTHTDGGALGNYTLGVTAGGHRHNEENIDETRLLVVDAAGRGDFTTLEAACTYLNSNGGGLEWVVLIRAGTYTDQDLSINQNAVLRVHWHGLGGVILSGLTTFVQYSNATIYNIKFNSVGGPLIYGVGTSGTVFHDCQFVTSGYNFSVLGDAFVATFYDCEFTFAPIVTGAAINGGQTFYRCTFNNNDAGWTIDNDIPGVPITYLYYCIFNNPFGSQQIKASVTPGRVNVFRCKYDTAATVGTITILDGDVPSSSAYATTAADLTLTSAHHWVTVTANGTRLTLPAASTCRGREYIISALAHSVIVDANASELIDGALTQVLGLYDTMQIRCTGTGWIII